MYAEYQLPNRTQHLKPPLSRGAGGVSRPSTATSNQMLPHKADKHHLTKQQQNNLIPTRTSHHNTPLNPLSRGESKTPQTPNCQTKKHYPILPSREGQGVCDAQAKPLKNQSNHQKPTNATSPNSSKTISSQSASLTITHPSIPSQEGKSHTTNHSLPRRNHHQKSPLSRGAGGVSR